MYFWDSTNTQRPIRDNFKWHDDDFVTSFSGTYHYATGICVSAQTNVEAAKSELDFHGETSVFQELYRYLVKNKRK